MAIARSELSGISKEHQQAFIDALSKAYGDATQELRRAAERRLVSDGRRLTATAKQSRALLIEVESILGQLDADSAALLAEHIPESYRRGARITNRGLREIGAAAPLAFDGAFHGSALQVLILDMQDALAQATEGMAKQFRTVIRRTQLRSITDKKITAQIAEGLITGQTRREVTKNLITGALKDFSDKPLMINGRHYDVAKYAKLVARTKTREAVVAGTINRQIESGNDLVMVTSHGATDGCGFYEGRVFSISGGSEIYPSVSSLPNGGPPFHPNCRHNLAPYVDGLATPTERRRASNIDRKALNKPYADVEKLSQGVAV